MGNSGGRFLSRRRLCLCCIGAGAGAAAGGWLKPREVFAEARGIVSLIKDSAAVSPIVTHKLRNNITVLEGSGGTVAVLTGPDGKVLIDAGIAVSRPQMMGSLTELGADLSARRGRSLADTRTAHPDVNPELNDVSPSPDSLRALVRGLKAQGADLIKLFASAGSVLAAPRRFPTSRSSAICSEAKAAGLRTVVHAISAQSVRAATLAGCTRDRARHVRHGRRAETDGRAWDDLRPAGVFGAAELCRPSRRLHEVRLHGRDVRAIAGAVPAATAMFRRALVSRLEIIFGTDAVALAHGRNADGCSVG